MKKLTYIIIWATVLLFAAGCGKEEQAGPVAEGFPIRLVSNGFQTRLLYDEDNLEVEQTIQNIAILFTEPSSDVIVNKYVNTGYFSQEDYKVVTLPLDITTLGRKDIYVVTNFDNASLNSIATLNDLRGKTTPAATKNNNLSPERGFCMFGKTMDFNFSTATGPAIVRTEKTCAKYRINLTFPGNATLSTQNTFVIANAASYTYIMEETGNTIPAKDYFNFPNQVELADNGSGVYTNVAYTYEAVVAPRLHIYTRMNNSGKQQEFSADLPVPERNYLYDIDVMIYEGQTRSLESEPQYILQTRITAYDPYGNRVK